MSINDDFDGICDSCGAGGCGKSPKKCPECNEKNIYYVRILDRIIAVLLKENIVHIHPPIELIYSIEFQSTL